MGGFSLFHMRRAFVSWLWKKKKHPALMFFFVVVVVVVVKLEGVFCLINSPEILFGFDW